jgi:hypothetical protein
MQSSGQLQVQALGPAGPVSRSAEIHVRLSAISGILWEGEVLGDGSRVFEFVLREAVGALQQHPGALILLIDTMELSPSSALGLFTPGHAYDVLVVVAESRKLLQTWFARWRHHTDFMPALVNPRVWIMPAWADPLEGFVLAPEDTNEHQVRGGSHFHDHVVVSMPALVDPHVWIMPAWAEPLEGFAPAPEVTNEHQDRGVSHYHDLVDVFLQERAANPSSSAMQSTTLAHQGLPTIYHRSSFPSQQECLGGRQHSTPALPIGLVGAPASCVFQSEAVDGTGACELLPFYLARPC